MSWGHLISKNLLNWTSAPVSPVLAPSQAYDSHGVFTGCWLPASISHDKTLRVLYSSISHLPFHWSTPPYPRNAAGLAMATSYDGGNNWIKSPHNPILQGEPAGLLVTGFRDPYVVDLSSNDTRETGPTGLYGLISGGIEGLGPTAFLYDIVDRTLGWNYVGPLVDVPLRYQPSRKWSGNYGVNWECTNLVTLHSESTTRHFLIIGAEGDVEKEHVKNYNQPMGAPSRTVRSQLWMMGHLVTTKSGAKFQYEHGGYLDHGPYYAANSFMEPKSGRRIVYGWIPEEDITLEAAKRKGWNGSLAMPREIFLLRIPNMDGVLRSELSEVYPFESIPESAGSNTILTLGVRPISEITQLRKKCSREKHLDTIIVLPQTDIAMINPLFQTFSTHWELQATISIRSGCERVGFHIYHNNMSIRASITFCAVTETITVERDSSSLDTSINKCPDAGPFTLLTKRNPDAEGGMTIEKLQFRIFFDGNIVEVFANDRFALATMVYFRNCNQGTGRVAAFATGSIDSATFETVTLWDGLDTNMTPL